MGHAYSAILAYRATTEYAGRFILRIEDIDTNRCKPEFIDAIYEDLTWLGLQWEQPVRLQSEHFTDYQAALDVLKEKKAVYPCFCTRSEIIAEIEKAQSAPHGPDGPLYPGTCKHLTQPERDVRIRSGEAHAWRLNLNTALSVIGPLPDWCDREKGPIKTTPSLLGDIVLARKDTPTSYHLSVVVDDAHQNINHIVRGNDLFHATHAHIVLQKLLGLPTPTYHHHSLLTDKNGERFAKRNRSATLKSLRETGMNAADLIAQIGL